MFKVNRYSNVIEKINNRVRYATVLNFLVVVLLRLTML
ncbi:putative nucleic acid-binding Zn ribbon protein [Chryseobacterium sp. PvR013]|nr:putative nucleic acid-binding Zn ribbon protein [Chryseobacterium sp. PvR013]